MDDVRRRAREDKGNYNQELKAIELKGKLAGHFNNKDNEVQAGNITVMGDVTIDGKTLAFEVGEDSDNDN